MSLMLEFAIKKLVNRDLLFEDECDAVLDYIKELEGQPLYNNTIKREKHIVTPAERADALNAMGIGDVECFIHEAASVCESTLNAMKTKNKQYKENGAPTRYKYYRLPQKGGKALIVSKVSGESDHA